MPGRGDRYAQTAEMLVNGVHIQINVREEPPDWLWKDGPLDEERFTVRQSHAFQAPDGAANLESQRTGIGLRRAAWLEDDDVPAWLFTQRPNPGGEAYELAERLREGRSPHGQEAALRTPDRAVGSQRRPGLTDGASRDPELPHQRIFGRERIARSQRSGGDLVPQRVRDLLVQGQTRLSRQFERATEMRC
jgi:hypothetical protein